jgi:hypothetical protein
LEAAESVCREAVETAEFTRCGKDVAYVQLVAEKIEKLKAKMDGRAQPMSVQVMLMGGRIEIEYSMALLDWRKR